MPRYCLGFRKTHSDAIVPKIGTGFSAGSDLHALFSYNIPAGDQVEVRTGVALDFVIKDDEKAMELQQLVSKEENIQESNNEFLRSSLKTPKKKNRLKKNVMFKEPIVDKIFGDIEIKNERFFLKVRSRSGMVAKYNISVVCYQKESLSSSGEIIVTIINTGCENFHLKAGMRFAQAIVHLNDIVEKEEGFIKNKLLKEEMCVPVMRDHGNFGKTLMFYSTKFCQVPPNCSDIINTGVVISLPNMSYYMQLQSPPFCSDYTIENLVHTTIDAGVIDADYRGEIKVILRNESKTQPIVIEPGMPLAMGVLYDVACPVTRLICITDAIENRISVDNRRNEINERMINNNLLICRECASSFLIFVKADTEIEKNSSQIINTGVYPKKDLKYTKSALDVQTADNSVIRVMNWKVSNDTGEIKLLVKSKNSNDKQHVKQGEVLAQVYVCSSPKFSLMHVTELDPQTRGTKGFGSTGMN